MSLRLVDTKAALEAGAIGSGGDNPKAMEAAIRASAPILENLIGTSFEMACRFDWFDYLPSPLQKKFREVLFLLRQGFVDRDQPFALYKTTSTDNRPVLQDLSNAEALVLGEDYIFDEERGTLTLLKPQPVGRSTLLFNYSAGFPVDGTGLADKDKVPNWLQQAQIAGAIRWALAMQHKWNNKERVDLTPEVVSIFRQHINEKIRPKYGVYPARSVTD